MRKKPKYIPHQSKLSVQDVYDYSTPEGAAMANEEMRRLKIALEVLTKKIEELGGAQAIPSTYIPPPVEEAQPERAVQQPPSVVNNYYQGPDMIAGYLILCQLDFDGEGKDYDPEHDKYGYYVYADIYHGWQLDDPDDYILHLVDMEQQFPDFYKGHVPEDLELQFYAIHPDQVYHPVDEGLTRNTVRVWGIYKPLDGILRYDDRGILITNLYFHFVLLRKDKHDGVGAQKVLGGIEGYIILDDNGDSWKLTVENGELKLYKVSEDKHDKIILFDPQSSKFYSVGARFLGDAGAEIVLEELGPEDPKAIRSVYYIRDEITGTWYSLGISSGSVVIMEV